MWQRSSRFVLFLFCRSCLCIKSFSPLARFAIPPTGAVSVIFCSFSVSTSITVSTNEELRGCNISLFHFLIGISRPVGRQNPVVAVHYLLLSTSMLLDLMPYVPMPFFVKCMRSYCAQYFRLCVYISLCREYGIKFNARTMLITATLALTNPSLHAIPPLHSLFSCSLD